MSHKASYWAWQQLLPLTQKMVLLRLADACDDLNSCYPSIGTLMTDCNIKSKNTVKGALKSLKDAGLIETHIRLRGNGSHTSNRYILMVDIKAEPQDVEGGGSKIDPPANDGEDAKEVGQKLTPTGQQLTQGGPSKCTPHNRHSNHTPLTPQGGNSSKDGKRKRKRSREPAKPQFNPATASEDDWTAYFAGLTYIPNRIHSHHKACGCSTCTIARKYKHQSPPKSGQGRPPAKPQVALERQQETKQKRKRA